MSRVGEFEDSIENCKVEISFDEKAKTLTISDSGIGMTEEEVEKYITQLAFSGAREFAEQWKDKDPDQMIGHFGLGFYSAFMVSKMVTIETKSYQKEHKPYTGIAMAQPVTTLAKANARSAEPMSFCI